MKKYVLLIILLVSFSSCNHQKENVKENINIEEDIDVRSTSEIWDDAANKYRSEIEQQNINLETLRTSNLTAEKLDGARIILDDAQRFFLKIVKQDSVFKRMRTEIYDYKKNIIKTQKVVYPKFRKAFTERAKNKMWEHDIEVYSSGTTITFIGYTFARNKNIKDSYESIASTLEEMRFKRVNFKWSEGSEYTYYTIDSPSDDTFIE